MKSLTIVFASLFFFAASFGQHSNLGNRLTPAEITALTPMGALSGTSGVSGIQSRVLKGDPTKVGLYTIQLTIPAETKIQPHTHPDDRVATVISGIWYIGYGSRFEEKDLKLLLPAVFIRNRQASLILLAPEKTP
jgi:hypothetical protein